MAVEVLTDDNFASTIKEEEKVVVKYFAGWCGSCRLFAPKYKRLSGDERFTDIKFLDVDAEKNPEARKLAGVTNLPFFAVFKGGELLGTVATSKEEGVVELLEKLN
ncbi:thioredoxin family protein [Fulvivirga ligni]|uniref:thioredoxin family protein n=1 Tax=Fulvivirga ligni TaxID=2904246 RepID=UPI001F3BF506|nr:thioredoxin family protein [Fulvivirga ligni]UII19373.1 thioredoxin family protein [Fulvivirga ligni]